MGVELFWLCDAEKHTECRKTCCYMRRHTDWASCESTSREEFAKIAPDGTKTLLYVRITEEEKDRTQPD